MEFTLGSLIAIALATMFFGYFFGLFEGRAQGYRRRKKEEPLERQVPLAAGTNATEPAPSSVKAQPAHGDAWLQLYSDPEGRPSLDLDGQRVDTARLTSDQHQRLIQLMVIMRPWIETGSHAAAPRSAAGPLEPSARPIAGPGSGAGGTNEISRDAKLPVGVAGAQAGSPPPDPNAPTSMVAQIDAILQARLQGTALASRGIRLAESLDGGVLVFVGQHSYPGVSEVPDAEVQAVIRSAISEWEKKYTPG